MTTALEYIVTYSAAVTNENNRVKFALNCNRTLARNILFSPIWDKNYEGMKFAFYNSARSDGAIIIGVEEWGTVLMPRSKKWKMSILLNVSNICTYYLFFWIRYGSEIYLWSGSRNNVYLIIIVYKTNSAIYHIVYMRNLQSYEIILFWFYTHYDIFLVVIGLLSTMVHMTTV